MEQPSMFRSSCHAESSLPLHPSLEEEPTSIPEVLHQRHSEEVHHLDGVLLHEATGTGEIWTHTDQGRSQDLARHAHQQDSIAAARGPTLPGQDLQEEGVADVTVQVEMEEEGEARATVATAVTMIEAGAEQEETEGEDDQRRFDLYSDGVRRIITVQMDTIGTRLYN